MQHLFMKYFVLKPRGKDIFAEASRKAMERYAEVIAEEHPSFALEIDNWVAHELRDAIEVAKREEDGDGE